MGARRASDRRMESRSASATLPPEAPQMNALIAFLAARGPDIAVVAAAALGALNP
jgi:hypothetical protein